MTGTNHNHEAVQALKAAEDALSPATELYHLKRAHVHATMAQPEPNPDADLAMAWRVLDAVAASIDKADTKAGFVATLNTAVLAGVLTLTDPERLATPGRMLVWFGVALMVAAVLFAGGVVLPILRARHTKHAPGNVLYFGTVRHHSPSVLVDRVSTGDTLHEVCAQAVTLSRLSWLKHRLLQFALWATIAGSNLVGWTFLLAGGAR